ncbi:MAG TPA: transporter substrate-binding domain-containing protein [Hansschlegelia sp.]
MTSQTLLRRGLAALALLMIGTAAQAATLDEIKAGKGMTIATEDSYKPFEFIEDGKPMGLDHDLLALLRKEAPFEIRQQIIPWTGLLAGVSTGKYDMALTAVVITGDRVKSLSFASPIAEATHYYVARADDDSIKSVADLSGKTAAVQSGGASALAIKELEPILEKTGGKVGKVVEYTSFPEAYQDLASGRVDYVVNGVVNSVSITNDAPTRFKLGQAVTAPSYAAWAVAKGNDALLDYVNAFLLAKRKDGTLYALQKKWLGKSFEDMPETVTK